MRNLLPEVAAFALLMVPAAVQAQDGFRTVSGVVSDSGGRPISYVSLDGGPRYRAITNASGEYTLRVNPKDAIEVSVRRIGFLPTKFKLEAGTGDTTIAVTMTQLAVLMNTQVVRARQLVTSLEYRGFYGRMLESQRGALVGDFVTPEEIEMRNPQRVTQLLDQKRGIRVTRVGNCYVVTQCFRVIGSGGCVATVYLDGQRLNRLADASGSSATAAPAIDELIPATGVAGIEIYARGALAPPQFQALSGTCAIVAIWTK
jgi:hypothetical protein